MNTIQFRGKRLKVFHYTGHLYRADCETFSRGSLASQNYRTAPMKYFTLEKGETSAYSRRGYPFIKTWRPSEPLILIDIFDVPTRNALKDLIGANGSTNAINIAFPLNNKGSVYRVSEENTKNKNDDVLRSICEQGVFDGYYMGKQVARNKVGTFHSEVGLCPSAFRKLVLESVEKDPSAPPCMKNRSNEKTRKRKRNNSNINKNNSPRPFKRSRLNGTLSAPKFSLSMFN